MASSPVFLSSLQHHQLGNRKQVIPRIEDKGNMFFRKNIHFVVFPGPSVKEKINALVFFICIPSLAAEDTWKVKTSVRLMAFSGWLSRLALLT